MLITTLLFILHRVIIIDGITYINLSIDANKDISGIKDVVNGVSNKPIKPTHRKVQCWIQEIQGISYYIDGEGNVYNHEDIVNNDVNPNIIAKYKYENMKYSIPAFFKS